MKYYEDFLMHHGILGQKWGVRRYQNPDGSLTDEGRRRYDIGESQNSDSTSSSNKLAKTYNDLKISKLSKQIDKNQARLEDLNKNGINSETFKKTYGNYSDAEWSYIYGRQNTKDKALKDLKRITEKSLKTSSVRLKVAKGEPLTEEEQKVYKNYNTKKLLLIGGAIVLGVAAASIVNANIATGDTYAGRKNAAKVLYDSDPSKMLNDVDLVINAGKTFYRQSPFKDVDLTNPHLYVATNDADRKLYRAFLGAGLARAGTGKHFDVSLKTINDIKAPSTKKVVQMFADLIENDDRFFEALTGRDARFRQQYLSYLDGHSTNNTFETAYRKMYALFNQKLVFGNNGIYDPGTAFINRVRDAGYNALVDLNDAGSFTKQPLILLDAKNDVVQTGQRQINANFKRFGLLTLPPGYTKFIVKNAANKLIYK